MAAVEEGKSDLEAGRSTDGETLRKELDL